MCAYACVCVREKERESARVWEWRWDREQKRRKKLFLDTLRPEKASFFLNLLTQADIDLHHELLGTGLSWGGGKRGRRGDAGWRHCSVDGAGIMYHSDSRPVLQNSPLNGSHFTPFVAIKLIKGFAKLCCQANTAHGRALAARALPIIFRSRILA